MLKKSSRRPAQSEVANFFIPMVDLMVSVIFVFIIVVMVLIMLIKATPEINESSDNSATSQQKSPIKAFIVEDLLANQNAQEILFNDTLRELLKQGGGDFNFDVINNKFEIKIFSPKKQEGVQ